VAIDHSIALSRRVAGSPRRGGRSGNVLWRLQPVWWRLVRLFDNPEIFASTYETPGWKRAQANRTDATNRNWGSRSGHQVERVGYGESGPRGVRTIEGELVAKSTTDTPSAFSIGDRVFHMKFGNGNVAAIEGNKLTIDFDKAGQKRVLDGFVTPV
jgi:DNA helicase II / ATP-dependent DNA helicase PcrA